MTPGTVLVEQEGDLAAVIYYDYDYRNPREGFRTQVVKLNPLAWHFDRRLRYYIRFAERRAARASKYYEAYRTREAEARKVVATCRTTTRSES